MQHPAMFPNPRKTGDVRDLGKVDIKLLQSAVQAIPEAVWNDHNARKPNRFDALGTTRHIVFRFIDHPWDWRFSHDLPPWADWQPLLGPVMAQAVAAYGYKAHAFPRVMLARMPTGGVIHPHIDANRAALWPHKIHVPIFSNAAVISHFGGKDHVFAPGQAVEVNNIAPHWVHNEGPTDRVHLIFEYYDRHQPEPDWLLHAPGTNSAP